MTKLKNVRAGIVIIADAGLKLAPVDIDGDGKSKPKNAPKVDEPKMSATDQGQASVSTVDENPVENDAAATSQSDEKPSTLCAGAKNASK